ncbi:type II secretion system ATPase GspE [Peredibacter starrii]|uniref:protein-secreting ATPase n=1 Tax=Peredibacter starrii TaxID=28202 RepID=A0AAX4HLF9_9BACT|nr:type II secretion system ATPase GspE [Peredibacter starrii]WPU64010.1 type II secretion system ATPase GspE [Peredibacter starrii]
MSLSNEVFENVEHSKEKIGELLIKFTSLTRSQLDEALEAQRVEGGLLGDILLKRNYIHPHDLIKIVCHQIGIPYQTDIKIEEIDANVVKDLSINYAKNHEVLPCMETDFSVTVLMSNPFNFNVVNDLHMIYKKEIKIICTTPLRIQDAINRVYEKANRNLVDSIEDEEFEENLDLEGPIDILDATADEAPVIRFVNSIIFRAVKERASDIHIEPYERDVVYRFRINGVMTEILRQPKKTHAAVSSRIKVMARLDIAEKRLPQDGRIKIKIAGKDIDIRLSTVPIQSGERIVMRVLEKNNTALNLETLGFRGKVLEGLQELGGRKHGVLYVTGPTGHGKTTTLFALLDRIKTPDKMIITVEDPVEYEIPGISQIQVNHKIELTFAVALRSILRQNPDVVMIGETRDRETAEIAINASLTGHFVLSTLHTNDASSAPTRLIDMGVQPFLISSSLAGVLAQRLIRTLCSACKQRTTLSDFEKVILDVNDIPDSATIFKPVGCGRCSNTGYSGRTVVSELLMMNDEIRALIIQKTDAATIKKAAVRAGMRTLRGDALDKIYEGITSVEEVMRAINAEETE